MAAGKTMVGVTDRLEAMLTRLKPGVRRLLSTGPAQKLLKRIVRLMPEGPGEAIRTGGRVVLRMKRYANAPRLAFPW